MAAAPPTSISETRRGLAYALGSYLLWGLLPLYFVYIAAVNPFEVVAWRIVFTLILCALLLTITRGWGETTRLLRSPKLLGIIAVAGLVIYLNWQTYVVATATGHIVEAALGYFVNPVVTILLGVIFLRERLRFWQWFALGSTAVAFVIISIGFGTFPWFALLLAFSFGIYGFLKKGLGGRVGALPGLFLETLMLLPVAAIILGYLQSTRGTLDLFHSPPLVTAMVIGTGITTAVPLLLFAAAARRISLTAIGFAQYLAPTMMFVIGWLVLGEEMPVARWIGFGIVWLSLVILSVDLVVSARRNRREIPPITGPIPPVIGP